MNLARSLAVFVLVGTQGAFGSNLRTNSPRIPFAFVENRGQEDAGVRFAGTDNRTKVFFSSEGAQFVRGDSRVTLKFDAARKNPAIEASDRLSGVANFFKGDRPDRWRTSVPLFGAIRYQSVWKGIDVRFRSDGSSLKSEYIVLAGDSTDSIRLRFDGFVSVRADGGIDVYNSPSERGQAVFSESAPLLYQEGAEGRSFVKGRYRVDPDGTVGFSVESYDRKKTLVIDPTIVLSGYFGDGAEGSIAAVAVNSFNNIVVSGWTLDPGLPAQYGAQNSYAGGVDAFVAGFTPDGGKLLFCTYLGGSGEDQALGIAVDSFNNTYITGWTSSANFPVAGAAQSRLSGPRDAFVTKLNATGSAILFSTYVGGSGADEGYGIALDSGNAPVIVGDTASTNLPGTAGTAGPRLGGGQDGFVAKLSADGHSVQFATYLGGSGTDHAAAVALDPANSIYVGGATYSTNFPVKNAAFAHSAGGQDAFVAELSPTGSSFLFSTYFGGSGGSPGFPEEVNAIAVVAGSVVVAGTTSSANLPITKVCVQASYGGGATDGFVARFNTGTGAFTRSTYFGGSGDDGINALAVDFYGFDLIAGYTDSGNLSVQNPIQGTPGGGMDGFVAKVGAYTLSWGTYWGGNGSDSINALAIDSMTSVIVAGQTGSANLPAVGSLGSYPGGEQSSFVAKISPSFTPALATAPNFLYDVWHDTGYNGPNVTLNAGTFGLPGDIPVAGDWNGTGIRKIGVFRNGLWILDMNGNGVYDSGDKTVSFGQGGDVPVVGDWNGTGTIKLGLYRNGSFILDLSGQLSGVPTGFSDAVFPFGLPGDIPVACDWNQSGTTKVGVFRNGQWLVDYNGDQVFNGLDKTYTFGQAGDIPVIGDWQGDGIPKIGVYRAGLWILDYGGVNKILNGGTLNLIFTFGGSGYLPLVL